MRAERKEGHAQMPDNPQKHEELNQFIEQNKRLPGALMPVMQKAQEIFGCVPMDVQIQIAEGLGLTLSEVYGVATFYSQFALEPMGEYVVSVCMGTACYVKGSQSVLDKLCDELSTTPNTTTPDGKFTIHATRCIGACGLAPVMTVNDDVYGRITPDQVAGILDKYRA